MPHCAPSDLASQTRGTNTSVPVDLFPIVCRIISWSVLPPSPVFSFSDHSWRQHKIDFRTPRAERVGCLSNVMLKTGWDIFGKRQIPVEALG
jgi:hypothetical protein